ncbi:cytochrome P450 [Kineococcus glutinatus]|uniref:Cytochrome P450 n=1 Tax=Kineococcus glutinatus TaxID=1070872 RepID=A0ABP9HUE3_9ACTN
MIRDGVRWTLQHGIPRQLVRRAARTGEPQGRLLTDPATWRDPYPLHAEVRARGELVPGSLSVLTASHRVTREVLGSADFGVVGPVEQLPGRLARLHAWAAQGAPVHPLAPPSLLGVDPPEHTRYRRLVSKVFTARAVEALRPRVRQTAGALLDDLARVAARPGGDGVADLVDGYAVRLPVAVIADILGVPEQRRDEVLAFQHGLAKSLDAATGWREFRAVEGSLRGFDDWIGRHLAQLRREPGEDLLSGLLAAEDDGTRLDERELRATAGLLLAAGFETTVNLIGSAAELLLTHPGQLAAVRADPELWPGAVEESLRLESPVQITSRAAQRDTRVAGHAVRRGTRLVTLLGAANRDPEVFADPERFDVRRPNARDHLAFSAGRHHCLGAALARLEGEEGLRALFERFPDLALAPGARRTSTRVLRGWEHLPVRLGGA